MVGDARCAMLFEHTRMALALAAASSTTSQFQNTHTTQTGTIWEEGMDTNN